ncbi:hypothetical protein IVA90_13025 [Bradyrhizobium sp. 151]|nr:hypothetical protein [Bradyrhizobium sp. 151]
MSDDPKTYYIQSSSDESYIEGFVKLPQRSNWRNNFAELRSNCSYVVGAPFLYGFRDNDNRVTVEEKFVLQLKLHDEFDRYGELPFLSFAIARFLENRELAVRVTEQRAIKSAIERGELVLPQFLEDAEAIASEGVGESEQADDDQAPRRSTFSPERVELLKTLWEAGLSASQIAAELGNVTRNAVIGKVHRLGLAARAKSPYSARSSQGPMDLETIREKILSSDELPSTAHLKSLTELDVQTCHWPVGSPESVEFVFCGAPTLTGLPYCASHARIAYQTASDRRKREAEDSSMGSGFDAGRSES